MVVSQIKQITTEKLTLNPEIRNIFEVFYAQEKNKIKINESEAKIKVSKVASSMAILYEKIRNAIDYKEEHLLRKNALDRILKRRVFISDFSTQLNGERVAEPLLEELIRAGYLENNSFPEKDIEKVVKILDKYFIFRKEILKRKWDKHRDELSNWVITMAACEIELLLSKSDEKQIITSSMFKTISSYISLADSELTEKEKKLQIYLSILRNFLKYDQDLLSLILLEYHYSNWYKADYELIKKVSTDIDVIRKVINSQINNPLGRKIDRITKKWTVYYLVLQDIIEQEGANKTYQLTFQEKKLVDKIIAISKKHYKQAKIKLHRSALRSIIYIFLTKMILAILLEVPVIIFLGDELNYLSLSINVTFPPLLLFSIVAFTNVGDEENTKKIVKGVENIIYKEKTEKISIEIKKAKKKSVLSTSLFSLFYLATFIISFGLIVWILKKIDFNIVSIIIFLFFLSVVSFFSLRIRKNAREFVVTDYKENLLTFLFDFFSIPIIEVGKWLSTKFSKINVFVFFMDFIIEAPFKIFIEVVDQWISFIKEKKDEII